MFKVIFLCFHLALVALLDLNLVYDSLVNVIYLIILVDKRLTEKLRLSSTAQCSIIKNSH